MNPVKKQNQGFTLPEALVFLSLISLVLGLASTSFFHIRKAMVAQEKYLHAVECGLRTGERLNRDIRESSSVITEFRHLISSNNCLVLQQAQKVIVYHVADGSLMRTEYLDNGKVIAASILDNVQDFNVSFENGLEGVFVHGIIRQNGSNPAINKALSHPFSGISCSGGYYEQW